MAGERYGSRALQPRQFSVVRRKALAPKRARFGAVPTVAITDGGNVTTPHCHVRSAAGFSLEDTALIELTSQNRTKHLGEVGLVESLSRRPDANPGQVLALRRRSVRGKYPGQKAPARSEPDCRTSVRERHKKTAAFSEKAYDRNQTREPKQPTLPGKTSAQRR